MSDLPMSMLLVNMRYRAHDADTVWAMMAKAKDAFNMEAQQVVFAALANGLFTPTKHPGYFEWLREPLNDADLTMIVNRAVPCFSFRWRGDVYRIEDYGCTEGLDFLVIRIRGPFVDLTPERLTMSIYRSFIVPEWGVLPDEFDLNALLNAEGTK